MHGRPQPSAVPLDFDDGEGGEWYEIDRVLDHRIVHVGRNRRPVTQFLVKWKGCDDAWNQWRDAAGVTQAAVDEYYARVGIANPAQRPVRNPQGVRKQFKRR